MTREELVEAMAKASFENELGKPDDWSHWPHMLDEHKSHARSAISAIEAAGFAIVPVVASDGMADIGRTALSVMGVDDPNDDDAAFCYTAMIQAAKDEMK
jgi:hypothetical protein